VVSLPTILGFLGAIITLAAYLLNQTGKWKAEDRIFSYANLAGSLLLIISLLWDWNIGAFLINFFWAGISLKALLKKRHERI
jgi:hypothetical protein